MLLTADRLIVGNNDLAPVHYPSSWGKLIARHLHFTSSRLSEWGKLSDF